MVSKPVVVGLATVLLTALFMAVIYSASAPGTTAISRPASDDRRDPVTAPSSTVTEKRPSSTASNPAVVDRKVAIVTYGYTGEMDQLRIFAGSVHHWHPGYPIIIYSRNMNKSELLEARNWEHAEVVEMYDILKDKRVSDDDWIPIALHDATELHGASLFIPRGQYLHKPITRVTSRLWQDGFVISAADDAPSDAPPSVACCNTATGAIGFVDNSTAFVHGLLPAATCAIIGSCRGAVGATLLGRLSELAAKGDLAHGGVSATSGADTCVCAAGGSVLASSVRTADLSNAKDGSREFMSHLLERDMTLVHRIHVAPKPKPAKPQQDGTQPQQPEQPQQNPTDTHTHGIKHDDRTLVCLIVPSTTRAKDGNPITTDVAALPLFQTLLKTFLNTVQGDFATGRFSYALYLGVDVGDPVYDDHARMEQVKTVFADLTAEIHMHLVVKKFGPENRGAPAWFWNGLFKEGYEDGCDYFYQLNDDIDLMTGGWTVRFVDVLKNNKRRSNLGMAGPQDVGNQKTMTQSFTHRTHYDIFETYYPASLKNWYSDDWATHIYDDVQSSFWIRDQQIRNQNQLGTRYHECGSCEGLYLQELAAGKNRLRDWLTAHPT